MTIAENNKGLDAISEADACAMSEKLAARIVDKIMPRFYTFYVRRAL